MPRSRKLAIAGVTAGLLSACAGSSPTLGPASSAVSVQQQLPAPDPLQNSRIQRTFVLGPFDEIKVAVFGAEALTRAGIVDSSGNFSMPLLGQVPASGKTPEQLEVYIADKLRGDYMRDPEVTVSVTEIRSRTLTVDGAVMLPGIYPVVGETTLQQAVAQARGTSEYAQLREVVVFRTIKGQKMAALFDLEAIRAGQTPDPQVYGDDIIVVGTNKARRNFKDIVSSIPVLGVFTPVL
ncbi:MAG: polysaccharide biosynthesis/export family protein [Tsuneonella sp.]